MFQESNERHNGNTYEPEDEKYDFNEEAEERGCDVWEDPRRDCLSPTGGEPMQEMEGEES